MTTDDLETMQSTHRTIASTLKKFWRAKIASTIYSVVKTVVVVVFFGFVVFNLFDHTKLTDHVAVVKIKGEIKDGGLASADVVLPLLNEAFANATSKGVILEMSSPGGSPDQSLMIYDEILRLKKLHNKPVDVVVTELCASGCYFIAAAADNIYTQQTSLIGSIGVITSSWDLTELMSKVGVSARTITAGENKAFLSPFAKTSDEQIKFWKEQLAITHQIFIDSVTESRGERLKIEDGMFSGLIYSAHNAKRIGLIDDFKTRDQLVRDNYASLPVAYYDLNAFAKRSMMTAMSDIMANAFSSVANQVTIK